MKNILLFIVFSVCAVYAIDDITIPVEFQDSAVIEAADFNSNFENFRDNYNALADTLENSFIRFNDVKDSSFQKVTTDSIRGNPDVDSLHGRPYIDSVDINFLNSTTGTPTVNKITSDSIRGNPDVDSLGGYIKTDSISTDYLDAVKVDINGGTMDGVVIGAAGEEDATFDSLYARVVNTTGSSFDSISFGNVGYTRCDTGSFPCTSSVIVGSYGAQTDTIGTAYWQKIGKIVTIAIRNWTITLNGNTEISILNFPDSLTPNTVSQRTQTGDVTGYGATVVLNENGSPNAYITAPSSENVTLVNPSFTYIITE